MQIAENVAIAATTAEIAALPNAIAALSINPQDRHRVPQAVPPPPQVTASTINLRVIVLLQAGVVSIADLAARVVIFKASVTKAASILIAHPISARTLWRRAIQRIRVLPRW